MLGIFICSRRYRNRLREIMLDSLRQQNEGISSIQFIQNTKKQDLCRDMNAYNKEHHDDDDELMNTEYCTRCTTNHNLTIAIVTLHLSAMCQSFLNNCSTKLKCLHLFRSTLGSHVHQRLWHSPLMQADQVYFMSLILLIFIKM